MTTRPLPAKPALVDKINGIEREVEQEWCADSSLKHAAENVARAREAQLPKPSWLDRLFNWRFF